MADIVRRTVGLGGPNSEPPARTRAAQPASDGKSPFRIFISYSREDLDFADQLEAALDTFGFDCVLDRYHISGGEEWKARLSALIGESDTVVFVLSPASAHSDICGWEVEESAKLGKRILPVVCRPLGDATPPPRLQALNYVFFHADPAAPGSGFGAGLRHLVEALNTDFDWLREHTRYLRRAIEWDEGGRPPSRLLSGADIAEARGWAARRPKTSPEPTPLQLDFIRASEQEEEARASSTRQQFAAMAAAQAERENALLEREAAVNHAREEQRRRAKTERIRNAALVLATIFAVVAGLAAWRAVPEQQVAEAQKDEAQEQKLQAETQQKEAESQRNQADAILGDATGIIVSAYDKLDDNLLRMAFNVFQAGAQHGSANAMLNLGLCYAGGHGTKQDYQQAREWLEKAAAAREPLAARRLAKLYENGQGVRPDDVQARKWYQTAAEWGEADSMVDLGFFYEIGRGGPPDYAKARQWYEEAARRDNMFAMHDLGELYDSGRGVPQDYGKAREWYEKAAQLTDADSMVALGFLYEKGRGGQTDYAKARDWYEKAAAKNNTVAMRNLASLYENGQGVKADDAKARQWYQAAADKGDAIAQERLESLGKRPPSQRTTP